MTWNRVAIDTLPLFGEPFNKRGGVANFAFRFRQRFTLFQRHQMRQIVLMFHHQIEPATQDIGSLFGGERAPGGQGAIGGVDGVARLFRPILGTLPSGFPLAGLLTGMTSPPRASRQSPSIKACWRNRVESLSCIIASCLKG